jgi:deoxyribodipyrimidine photo-lyase
MIHVKTQTELLEMIDAVDPVAYTQTRNHLSGAVTKLSPYITRGVMTLPQIRDRLHQKHSAKDCEKLIQELAWREYFQEVWWEKGDQIFSDLRFSRADWRHEELATVLVEANTGVVVLDEAIKELYETGYMHNHARMWVASVACNLGKAHWYPMGRWLYYHLADGDPASNFCSWQWVAGTSISKQYTVNQKLINGCSDHKQIRSILTFDRDSMSDQPLPDVLEPHHTFDLTTSYPEATATDNVSGEAVVLYTPWTLDPTYQPDQSTRRILVIDPIWFDRLPVSDLVMNFILEQGKTVIAGLEVFVGAAADIPGIQEATSVHARSHQTNVTWSAYTTLEAAPKLFPQISGYYKSFFAYWKACEKMK